MDLAGALRAFFSKNNSAIQKIPLVFVYGTEIEAMMLTKLRAEGGSTYFDLDSYLPSYLKRNEQVPGLGLCSLFEQCLFKHCLYCTHLPDICLPLHDRSFSRDVQTLVVREEQGYLHIKAFFDSILLNEFAFEMILCM